ncbi:uncharacterized protein LOC110985958 isoform X2 [Acanthaster planci]|uniref:Uncharacterized protein LOC110985958 isoform X2 n=1 Tax=Acanthaster planci TaxID=133434 RepID=A0A8B7ZBV5_ACAPL|nr:uncharacterized protein LOC110985958 isoform X2 [Acanthaster planci]
MEADSTCERTPEDFAKTPGDSVCATTYVSNSCLDGTEADEEEDQPADIGNDGRATVSGSSGSNSEAMCTIDCNQRAMQVSALDSLVDSSCSEATNEADTASAREPSEDIIFTSDETENSVETHASSKCLLKDDISIALTDVSVLEPHKQSGKGGNRAMVLSQKIEGSQAKGECQTSEGTLSGRELPTSEGSQTTENLRTSRDNQAVECSQAAEGTEAITNSPAMDCAHATEGSQFTRDQNSKVGSQESKDSQATQDACGLDVTKKFQAHRSSQATGGSQAVESSEATEGSQAVEDIHAGEFSQDAEGFQAGRGSHLAENSQATCIKCPNNTEDLQASVDPSLHSLYCVSTEKGHTPFIVDMTTTPATEMPIDTPDCLKGIPHDSITDVNASAELVDEEDDLYSEIIATTTKVKILKKYYGDVTRPGICHRPHPKRYYGSFECEECLRSFSYLPSLLFHRNRHGKRCHVYSCSKCTYKSVLPGAFTRHELLCHSDQLFRCHVCDITFLQKSTLRRHKSASHGLQHAAVPGQGHPVNYACNLCKGVFSSQVAVKNHLQLQHEIAACPGLINSHSATQADDPVSRYYHEVPCCPAKSSQLFQAIDEIRCKKCKLVFPKQGMAFVQHRQASDALAKTHCKWCKYKGTSPCQLARHKRVVHFWCLLCDCRLANKELLKLHTKLVHYGFKKREGFAKGAMSPKGSKDQRHASCQHEHQCLKCLRTFSSSKHFKRHMKELHEEDGNSQVAADAEVVHHWYCTTCNVIFPTKRLLELHVKLNHRPMKRAEASPLQRLGLSKKDQEWRCLLCNTLHPTLQDCDKHLIMHHPDEYEYCCREEIAEPTLPLPSSTLSELGPPYTCNMCDCKVTSVEALHKHKEQFHKLAYSISISDELYAKKRMHKCRYGCGFTDRMYRNVTQHQLGCKLRPVRKCKDTSQSPTVLDPSSGKVMSDGTAISCIEETPKQLSTEHEADNTCVKELTGFEGAPQLVCINQDVNMAACSDNIATPGVAERQEEIVIPVSTNQHPAFSAPVSSVESGLNKPRWSATSGSDSTSGASQKVTQFNVIRPLSRTEHPQSVKLPVYGKHDPISSSSDNESDCSWLDKSSSSEELEEASPSADSAAEVEAISSEEEDEQAGSVREPSVLSSQSQAAGLVGQGVQGKAAGIPSNPCPPLLQPNVLMRFFQAIDMSDLYRLALQMITGSPQPHTLPASDPAMVSSKTAKFKYKIPLGFSHPEFKEMPLFPSSKEVKRLDYLQTLPSSLISKHYKGVLAKPYRSHLSSLVDSAVLNHLSENTIKVVERYVRKQRVDDRKDITLNLSQYIVSQYFKNQQKKISVTQPNSSNLTSENSPGAGPSGAQTKSPTIRLMITKTTRNPAIAPVLTVKSVAIQPSVSNAGSSPVETNLVLNRTLPLTKEMLNRGSPTSVDGNTNIPVTATDTNVSGVGQTKSDDTAVSEKSSLLSEGKKDELTPGSKVKKSAAAHEITTNKPALYNVPVRRSTRLLKGTGNEQSSSIAANGLIDSEKSDISQNQEAQPKGKKADSVMDDEANRYTSEETDADQSDPKQGKKPSSEGQCKNSFSQLTNDKSDDINPKSRPRSPESRPQLGFTGITDMSRERPSAESQPQEAPTSTVLHNVHNTMLQMAPDVRFPLVPYGNKLLADRILSDTIERDGILQTRMAGHPLHGGNGGTMPRPIISNTGCVTGLGIVLNGKMHVMQTEPAIKEMSSPCGQSMLLRNLLLKGVKDEDCKQSLASTELGPLDDPLLQQDTDSAASHVPRGYGHLAKSGVCSSAISSLLNKMHLTPRDTSTNPQVPATDPGNSVRHKWKKVLSKHDALAVVTKKKSSRFAPYKKILQKILLRKDGRTSIATIDELQTSDSDGLHKEKAILDSEEKSQVEHVCTLSKSASAGSSPHGHLRCTHQTKKHSDHTYSFSKISGKNDRDTKFSTSLGTTKRQATPEPADIPQKKMRGSESYCCTEETLPSGSLSAHPVPGEQDVLAESSGVILSNQSIPQSIANTAPTDVQLKSMKEAQKVVKSTQEMVVQGPASRDSKNGKFNSEATDGGKGSVDMPTPDATEETKITRRSLRLQEAEKKMELEMYYKPKFSDKNWRQEFLQRLSKTPVMSKGAQKGSIGSNKTKRGRLLFQRTHHYMGGNFQRNSPRIKAMHRVDYACCWKLHDGMKQNQTTRAEVVRSSSRIQAMPKVDYSYCWTMQDGIKGNKAPDKRNGSRQDSIPRAESIPERSSSEIQAIPNVDCISFRTAQDGIKGNQVCYAGNNPFPGRRDGSIPQGSSSQVQSMPKVDSTCCRKTENEVKGNRVPCVGSQKDLAPDEGMSSEDEKLMRDKDQKGNSESHPQSEGQSYTTFPKPLQEQIAAMGRCFVRLSPVSVDKDRCHNKQTPVSLDKSCMDRCSVRLTPINLDKDHCNVRQMPVIVEKCVDRCFVRLAPINLDKNYQDLCSLEDINKSHKDLCSSDNISMDVDPCTLEDVDKNHKNICSSKGIDENCKHLCSTEDIDKDKDPCSLEDIDKNYKDFCSSEGIDKNHKDLCSSEDIDKDKDLCSLKDIDKSQKDICSSENIDKNHFYSSKDSQENIDKNEAPCSSEDNDKTHKDFSSSEDIDDNRKNLCPLEDADENHKDLCSQENIDKDEAPCFSEDNDKTHKDFSSSEDIDENRKNLYPLEDVDENHKDLCSSEDIDKNNVDFCSSKDDNNKDLCMTEDIDENSICPSGDSDS